jgi:hypothetical protein
MSRTKSRLKYEFLYSLVSEWLAKPSAVVTFRIGVILEEIWSNSILITAGMSRTDTSKRWLNSMFVYLLRIRIIS